MGKVYFYIFNTGCIYQSYVIYSSSRIGAWTSADEYGGLQQSLLSGSGARAHQAERGGKKERCSYSGAGGLHW